MSAVFMGATFLVLEDEPIIAMDLQLELEDAGATVVRLSEIGRALACLDDHDFAGAVLDYSLQSRTTAEPVAHALDARGVAYVFYSGDLDRHGEAISRHGAPVIAKPTPARDVMRILGDRIALVASRDDAGG